MASVSSRALRPLMPLAAISLVGGCVTMTDPVPVGPDTYMLGLGAHGGLSSDAELLSQTIKAASAFCAGQQRQLQVVGESHSGVQGWTPQSNQVTFKCNKTAG